jgi:transposase
MGHLLMSQKERERLVECKEVAEGKKSIRRAAERLRMSYRQGRRVYRRYRTEGEVGLLHRSRGRRSNRCKPEVFREAVLKQYQEEFTGWGPTLAAEKFQAQGKRVDHETLRRWLLEAGLRQVQRKRSPYRSWRERRDSCNARNVWAHEPGHDHEDIWLKNQPVFGRWIFGKAQECAMAKTSTGIEEVQEGSLREGLEAVIRERVGKLIELVLEEEVEVGVSAGVEEHLSNSTGGARSQWFGRRSPPVAPALFQGCVEAPHSFNSVAPNGILYARQPLSSSWLLPRPQKQCCRLTILEPSGKHGSTHDPTSRTLFRRYRLFRISLSQQRRPEQRLIPT